MRAIRPADDSDASAITEAILLLRKARDLLRDAGASRAVNRVRDALSSAEGAERHVRHRRYRTARQSAG